MLAAVLLLVSCDSAAMSEVVCEAVTLYKEAESESDSGKRAVLDVIRWRANVLGKSSCAVVLQQGQFSFVHKNFKWKLTQNMLRDWQRVDPMQAVLEGAWYFNSGKRIKKYKFIRRIGRHNFYRK